MTQPPYPGQPPQTGPIYPQPNNPYPQTGPNNPGYPPQPHNQPYPPQPPPPTPTSKTKTGIIITMSVIIVALAIIVVYLAYHEKDTPTTSTTPTPTTNTTPTPTPIRTPTLTRTPTPGRGWTLNGDQLTAPTMTAQLPQGWRIGEQNGAGNDGDITDSKSRIKYWFGVPQAPEEFCKKAIRDNQKYPSNPIKEIPGKTWGGKPVITYQMTTEESSQPVIFTFSCLDTGNRTSALLQTVTWAEYNEQATNVTQLLLTTWKWR